MSEYQYYEFVALDRPLTPRERSSLRRISTRAEITTTRFTNEYHWGDLKADPAKLLARYFDAHLYYANWGTHRLMFRLPATRFDARKLRRYFPGDSAELRRAGKYLIVDFSSDDEDFADDWTDASLGALTPLRADFLKGDLRAAYLGWLLSAQMGELDNDAKEPPVPAGLGKLSASLTALAEFLRIDKFWLKAAAARSSKSGKRSPLKRATLPKSERSVEELRNQAAALRSTQGRRAAKRPKSKTTRRDSRFLEGEA